MIAPALRLLRLTVLLTLLPALAVAAAPRTLADFQPAAASFHAVLTLPDFERTPAELEATVAKVIAGGDATLNLIAGQDPGQVTFAGTIGALDDITFRYKNAYYRLGFIQETHPEKAMRDKASEMSVKLQQWGIGLDYREDVYAAVRAYAKTSPALTGEDLKIFEETLRDYRRAGLDLPPAGRKEVERLRQELAKLETDFANNINQARAPLVFTKAELAGVPESFLASPGVKTGDDQYTVMANITWHATAVLDNARREDIRRKVYAVRDQLARDANAPLLSQIVELRADIARRLGYSSWADYVIEIKMAKNGATAQQFENDITAGLQPKFDAELAVLRKLKAAETGEAAPVINLWDARYYINQLKKQRYDIDTEQLRVYFPYQATLEGMFRIYERIFGLKFALIEAPYKWVGDLQLYVVTDAATGEPMGCFYLDMFPREGKFNHFACFELTPGKRLDDGSYQRPVVSLVCNFPPPSPGQPSLLKHEDAETLFHEFGHVMHNVLTRAKFARHAGSDVPGDFVEAPSQMLENWVWDKKVLDTFAADYRDPAKKIPAEIIAQLKQAKLATMGMFYRRQLAFGQLDLALHAHFEPGRKIDAVALTNPILSQVYLPVLPETTFVTYFGHLVGYDAGYYGYAWADAIAADMATVFQNAPDGFLDQTAGLRLRNAIYATGDSRDVSESIEKFLGRPRSLKPFLKKIGIE